MVLLVEITKMTTMITNNDDDYDEIRMNLGPIAQSEPAATQANTPT